MREKKTEGGNLRAKRFKRDYRPTVTGLGWVLSQTAKNYETISGNTNTD